MAGNIDTRIPLKRLQEVLKNLQAFTGISVQLIDRDGSLLLAYGEPNTYCGILKKNVFTAGECFQLHLKAGQRAQRIGQAYVFACHADLNHIAFPLTDRDMLLGTVILGPFMMDEADSTLVSGLAEKYDLTPALSLELYDELSGIPVIAPEKAGQLQKLVDHLISPLIPGERAALLQNQEKTYQQAKIGESIRVYKEQQAQTSLIFFHKKEKSNIRLF